MKWTSFLYQSAIAVYARLPLKKQLCTFLRMLPVPKDKFYRDLKFKGPFDTMLDGRKLKLINFGYEVENEIFWKGIAGGWEKVSLGVWITLCRDAQEIIDIGANTGIYSLIAAHMNPKATIHAFEPSEKMVHKFRKAIALNGFSNIRVEPVAVSDRNGQAPFFDVPDEHQYSASLNKDMLGPDVATVISNIPVITLDAFIKQKQLQRIDLLKIDVEMHEPEVLEGFGEHLNVFMPTMIIEILSDEIGARIEMQLQGMDYLYFNIDEVNPPRQVQHLSKSGCYNFLVCTETVAKRLKLM